MGKFSITKNGYDIKQVDDYLYDLSENYEKQLREQKLRINDLKRTLEQTEQQLASYKQKNSDISDALIVAVETAKQIENSSKNIYNLEIKRVRSLYDKWKKFLDDFMAKYPALKSKYDTKLLLDVFSNDIEEILKQNKQSIEQKDAVAIQSSEAVTTNTIGLRMLINKMGNTNRPILPGISSQSIKKADTPIVRNPKPSNETLQNYKVQLTSEEEENRLAKDKIKPISNMTLNKGDNYENLVDKFLTSDDDEYQDSAYSKILLEKQKNDDFDLKEAVTPTEDLDEIMRSFSFYPENDKGKKQTK
jgi:hypothetical protein